MTATMYLDGEPVALASLSLDLPRPEPSAVDIVTTNAHGTIATDAENRATFAAVWFQLVTWPVMRRRLLTSSAIVAPAAAAPPQT